MEPLDCLIAADQPIELHERPIIVGHVLRVTHCPVNTAGIPWANVQALRDRGVDARLVVFNRYRLHPEALTRLAAVLETAAVPA